MIKNFNFSMPCNDAPCMYRFLPFQKVVACHNLGMGKSHPPLPFLALNLSFTGKKKTMIVVSSKTDSCLYLKDYLLAQQVE